MAVASAPRLTGGIAASLVLHAALVTAFFLMRPAALPPSPPVYRVQLLAAPPGERAVGVVQPPTPAPATPAQTPAAKPAVPKPVVTRPKRTAKRAEAPRRTTPAPVQTKPAEPATPAPKEAAPPKAGGGATGGSGTDVATINTSGVDFPYPGYINNIARQVILQFHPGRAMLTNSVRFIIRRDGTVDPESIHLVTSSGNYSFDQQALAAVEAAANAKVFGPLPAGFQEDILPVTFRFSPSLFR